MGEYIMVAAIDFGTTFSGYAFSFKSDKENIKMNKNWGSNLGFQSYKTPTCVLLEPNGEFDSFGYEAENNYGAIVEETQGSKGWSIFRHFKMTLHKSGKDGNVSRSKVLCSSSGTIMPAMDIFKMALAFLKKHMLDAVSKQVTSPPDDSMIRWVITVPAIWSDESKQFMREAAFKAGFIKSMDSRQLVIALEPEAASLYCRRLDVSHFMGDNRKPLQFQRGIKYLVIDSGGGTVDVTAHEILGGENVKELHAATGGAWGGTKVDDNFINLLKQVLGEKFVKDYEKKHPQQWLQLMVNFERIKRSAKPDGKTNMNLQLSYSMGTTYKEMTGQAIEKVIASKKNLGVSFNNGLLIIEYRKVKELFDPVLKNITDHIAELLKDRRIQPCKYFFLVGGFSESEFLQKAIKDNFGGKIDILVPSEAQMSVIKGAVLFGHNPDEIKIRVAARTYGYSHLTGFQEGKHDPKKKEIHDGIAKCSDLFGVFVKEGDDVPNGYSCHRTFTPVRADLDGADICFYSMDGKPKDIQYVDEPNVRSMGSLHIEMPNKEGGRNRKVETDIVFGGTEIHVEATDVTSGKKAATKLDFLT